MEGRWIKEGGVLWKEKARALQLRIRERFRVAVDRHSQWPEDSSHSIPTLQHWIHRVGSLFRDASSRPPPSSSYKFYRKRVGKNVEAVDDSIVIRLLQALAVPVIGNACHAFMHGLNHVQIYGAEKLHQALLQRPEGVPLITVSNHVASVDDPFVIASLLPPSIMLDARNIRWTLCATDRCFSNPMLSAFFRCVKVLPVSRGDGVYQKGMDMALSKINKGGWVHIFPEGSRSRDGGRTIGAAKRGVGRLVLDADNVPVVVPFVHTGMQEIMPIGTHLPKTGKRVTLLVGDPINFEDLLLSLDNTNDSRGILYDAVSSRITRRLQELKVQVDSLALKHTTVVQGYCDHAGRIWEQVDWEAFGMESYTSSEEDALTRKPLTPNDMCTVKSQMPRHARPSIHVGFSYEGGIMSRIRGYMNPSELMGFAARGLFMNGRTLKGSQTNVQVVGRLKSWKQLLESHWNGM